MSVQQINEGAGQLLAAAKIKALEFRMAAVWFLLFTTVSLAAAIQTALTNANWSNMGGQDKFLMCIGVFTSWGTTMMAFFSKAAKKVEQQITPDSGSTAFFRQTTDVQQQTTKITQPPTEQTK